jgi:hypothetical protein
MKKYEQIKAIIDKNLPLYFEKYLSNIKILDKNIKKAEEMAAAVHSLQKNIFFQHSAKQNKYF